jgi:hypothetical protein
MSRRLSNIEWATFQDEVNLERMDLPQWGGIVQWRGLSVLVYRPSVNCNWMAKLIGTCPVGELFLTDVSDLGDLDSRFTKNYDVNTDQWWYYLPEVTMEVTAERAADAGALIAATGEVIGKTAGAMTGPILGNLAIPLIVTGILGMVFLARK